MDRLSTERFILLAVFIGLGALLYLLTGPMIRRRVKPNWGCGLRVPATMSDESVWYDANEASGRDLRRVVQICSAVAAVGFLSPIADAVFGLGLAAAYVVGLITATVVGWRRANRMFRARQTA